MTAHAIVLAAGKGTRMSSELPKVLHRAAGRPMIEWCLDAVAGFDDVVVVVGHGAAEVEGALPTGVTSVIQEPQEGTGHATEVGLGAVDVATGDLVLVMPGDMPLVRRETVDLLVERHVESDAAATLLSATVDDPDGYGRVVRDSSGAVTAIVEHADADDTQRRIREINTSVYVFDAAELASSLAVVDAKNAQGERYLTDVVGVLAAAGRSVEALIVDPEEAGGVNSHADLAAAAAVLRRRVNEKWMLAGVQMTDPGRVYLDHSAELEPGVTLYPDVHLEGSTKVAAGAVVGPGVYAVDADIGSGARVMSSTLAGAAVGEGAVVGPYAHLRTGTRLGAAAKAGSFVEIKESTIGEGAKVPHLAYVGDATVGDRANVGAGSITVNYDGFVKHRTVIGDDARIGSATMLVAPVEVGEGAYTGAGSVVTRDVEAGALAVSRSPQRQYPGYAARRQRRASGERS